MKFLLISVMLASSAFAQQVGEVKEASFVKAHSDSREYIFRNETKILISNEKFDHWAYANAFCLNKQMQLATVEDQYDFAFADRSDRSIMSTFLFEHTTPDGNKLSGLVGWLDIMKFTNEGLVDIYMAIDGETEIRGGGFEIFNHFTKLKLPAVCSDPLPTPSIRVNSTSRNLIPIKDEFSGSDRKPNPKTSTRQ